MIRSLFLDVALLPLRSDLDPLSFVFLLLASIALLVFAVRRVIARRKKARSEKKKSEPQKRVDRDADQ